MHDLVCSLIAFDHKNDFIEKIYSDMHYHLCAKRHSHVSSRVFFFSLSMNKECSGKNLPWGIGE